jgi:hypothetical protein
VGLRLHLRLPCPADGGFSLTPEPRTRMAATAATFPAPAVPRRCHPARARRSPMFTTSVASSRLPSTTLTSARSTPTQITTPTTMLLTGGRSAVTFPSRISSRCRPRNHDPLCRFRPRSRSPTSKRTIKRRELRPPVPTTMTRRTNRSWACRALPAAARCPGCRPQRLEKECYSDWRQGTTSSLPLLDRLIGRNQGGAQ